MEESGQLGQRCGGGAGCQLGGGPLRGFIVKPTPGHSPASFRSRFSGIPSWFPQQTPGHPPGRSLPHGVTHGGDAAPVLSISGDPHARLTRCAGRRLAPGDSEPGGPWNHCPREQEPGVLTCVQDLYSMRALSVALALPTGTSPGSPGLRSRQVIGAHLTARKPRAGGRSGTGPRWVLLPRGVPSAPRSPRRADCADGFQGPIPT